MKDYIKSKEYQDNPKKKIQWTKIRDIANFGTESGDEKQV
jgi:hypothetical protein